MNQTYSERLQFFNPKMPKTQITKKSSDKEETLTLETILSLGGNKDDYALIKNVDINDEENDIDIEDDNSEQINDNDIKIFIDKLQLKKYRNVSIDHNKKKQNVVIDDTDKSLTIKNKEKNMKNLTLKLENSKAKSINNTNVLKIKASGSAIDSKINKHGEDLHAVINLYEPHTKLLITDYDFWNVPQTLNYSESDNSNIIKIKNYAAKLYDTEIKIFQADDAKKNKSENKWFKTVLKSGTLKDKTAALTVCIQKSPLHNIKYLDALLNMVKKKGRREALMSLDTLKELFISELLPNRKLLDFNQRPVSDLNWTKRINEDRSICLIQWYFESLLKEKLHEFYEALSNLLTDQISASKQKALGTIYELLVNKPEKEKDFLILLVNKLGDPDYKIASKSCNLLKKLIESHPKWKCFVVDEVESILYRPNISLKAQYYSICFLNQIFFANDENKLAARLLKIYFSFFKAFIKREEVDSKIMSGLLVGVNRAFVYAKDEKQSILDEIEPLYKIVHTVNFNTSIQGLMLLYQVMDANDNISDRYYTSLYRKLNDPNLNKSSKKAQFLHLVYKSIGKDTSEKRIKAFVKRMLEISCFTSASFACSILLILNELQREKKQLFVTEKSDQDSDDEEKFVDQPDEDDENNRNFTMENEQNRSDSSWMHKNNFGVKSGITSFQSNVRNPLYANAEYECAWELKKLEQHFHPSVSLFASNLLNRKHSYYNGDPLTDFTLIRFLDRFVYRNPKIDHSDSKKKAAKSFSVNSEEFSLKNEADIPVDEIFFHKYFKQHPEKQKRNEDDNDSLHSVSDDEFDSFLDGKKTKTILKKPQITKSKNVNSKMRNNENDEMDEEMDIDEEFTDETSDIDDDFDFDEPISKRKKTEDLSGLFADAEEFAEYLEDGAINKIHKVTSNAYINKDHATNKQLDWESKREISGKFDWKQNKRKRFSKTKQENKKRK